MPTLAPTLGPTPWPTPTPRQPSSVAFAAATEFSTRFFQPASGEYYNLGLLLEKYPHLHFGGSSISFYGVVWDSQCIRNGESYPISTCYPEYEAECPGKFLPEIVPHRPGCLGSPDAQSWHFFVKMREPLSAPETMPERDLPYTSSSLDNGQIIRYTIPLEIEVDSSAEQSVYVAALGEEFNWVSEIQRQFPHLRFDEETVYFHGTLASDVCTKNDEYYGTGCLDRYEEECDLFVQEVVPGRAGCLNGEEGLRKSFGVIYSRSGEVVEGSFTVPEGARAFQLATLDNWLIELIDPHGKDYVAAFGDVALERSAAPMPIRILRNRSIAITQATSDVDYSFEDVVIPGEWTFKAGRTNDRDDSVAVVVIKTRNDPDDKVRLKVVNATTLPNEAFAPRLDRMVQLAGRLGINMEVSAIERLPHLDDPHAPPIDFCERICSSDEAVVLISEPGGWSSPGPGIALRVAYNTHFLVGVEVVTSENDHYIAAATHELLHYVAGLGHLYDTHPGGSIDVDSLASTGLQNQVVGRTTRIGGGVNHERMWENGELLWDDNILIGWRMIHNGQDVDGFVSKDDHGRLNTLMTFLEHHQLEWLKDSPLYW